MADETRYDALLAKADEAAARALEAVAGTPGANRGQLHAALAAMWMEAARVEQQAIEGERQRQTYARIMGRLTKIEARLEIYVPEADQVID